MWVEVFPNALKPANKGRRTGSLWPIPDTRTEGYGGPRLSIFFKHQENDMARETGSCEWCRESMRLDPARIIRDFNGTVLMRDPQGRLHSFARGKRVEEVEQEQKANHVEKSFNEMLNNVVLEVLTDAPSPE
jgi:hypothetical protein